MRTALLRRRFRNDARCQRRVMGIDGLVATRRHAGLGIVLALVLASVGIVGMFVPYTAKGSGLHNGPLWSVLTGCPNDEGEAVASTQSAPGAQHRCRRDGVARLLVSGAVVTGAVMLFRFSTEVSNPRRR